MDDRQDPGQPGTQHPRAFAGVDQRGFRLLLLAGQDVGGLPGAVHHRGASNKDGEGGIRASTAAGFYGDGLTLWPANVFRQCGMRVSVEGAKLFGTTNPDGPFH